MKTRSSSRRSPRAYRPALERLESRDVPAVFTVTTGLDSGGGSLRAAITSANANGVGADTIQFAASVTTVSLSTRGGTQFGPNAFEITSNITIVGAGQTINRVNAAPNFRLFFVAPTATLTLSDLTLKGGRAVGGNGGTNLGDDGSLGLLGVIYPPQVALLGVGRITMRPRVIDGSVASRDCVTLSLAADHRVSDGRRGALFLSRIATLLQQPEAL